MELYKCVFVSVDLYTNTRKHFYSDVKHLIFTCSYWLLFNLSLSVSFPPPPAPPPSMAYSPLLSFSHRYTFVQLLPFSDANYLGM